MVDTDLSFCELRSKEIINCIDGKRLGRIMDIVFNANSGVIKGIVAPYAKRAVFAKTQDIFIPWKCVKKIGEDVIIVEITQDFAPMPRTQKQGSCATYVYSPQECERPQDDCKPECKPKPPRPNPRPDCDGRCEKCMLFDCSKRWKTCSLPEGEKGEDTN